MKPLRVGIVGVGAIGGHLAGVLLSGQTDVTLCLRHRHVETFQTQGLQVQYTSQADEVVAQKFAPTQFHLHTLDSLPDVDLLILTIKTQHWPALLKQWIAAATHLPPVILCLQNGVGFHEQVANDLQLHFPKNLPEVLGGMVPFNVVFEAGIYRQSSLGPYYFSKNESVQVDRLKQHLKKAKFSFVEQENFLGFQWTKLLLNLNNSINALSGDSLNDQIANSNFRRVFAQAMQEGLRVAHKKNIQLEKIQGLSPQTMLHLLRLPRFLFLPLLKFVFRIEKNSRTSMAQDFLARRPTEIETLNGFVVTEGESLQIPTPINRFLVEEVRKVEAAAFSDEVLMSARQALTQRGSEL